MKRFLIACTGVCLSFALMAQRPSVNLQRASVEPIVDGVIDEVWAEAGDAVSIELFSTTNPPTLGNPGETTWKGLWTYGGIYILLEVADDDFFPHYEIPGTNSWEYDKPELYFDVNWVLEDGLGPMSNQGHYQVAPFFIDGLTDGTPLTCGFNGTEGEIVEYAFLVDDPTYIAEYFIPYTDLLDNEGISVDLTNEIGFDVTIIDRDEGDSEYKSAVWVNTGDAGGSWANMDLCGSIYLEGAGEGTPIEELVLTGGEIMENNGTLQVQADFVPEDASNQTLQWSLKNITGKATIDKDGIVRGIIDGEVEVTATSTDGSYVEATTTVTISNQVVTLSEINVIRNPYFEDPEGTSPAYWGGWGGDAGTPMPTVGNGFAVCTPIEAAEVWQYSFSQSGLTADPDIDYFLSFLGFADDVRPFQVGFEDTQENNYNRYGSSSDPRSSDGRSQWNFELSADPTWYSFDVNFDEIVESTVQMLSFQMGTSAQAVYLDSILLISVADSVRLTDYTPIEDIVVSGEGGSSEVSLGSTLQLLAEVFPLEADFKDVKWSVEEGSGQATIDENGLLTPTSMGMVTVMATAMDDSDAIGELEVSIGYGVGRQNKNVPQIILFPNPAGDFLRVALPNQKQVIQVYNSSGALMDQVQVQERTFSLDVSAYLPGVYFIKAGNAVGRFVK